LCFRENLLAGRLQDAESMLQRHRLMGWRVAGAGLACLTFVTTVSGCGRRLIGRLPVDGGMPGVLSDEDAGSDGGGGDGASDRAASDRGDGGVVPGTIAWTAAGLPVQDADGNFYTTARDANTARFTRIDRASGEPLWQQPGTFFCFAGGAVVLRDRYGSGPATVFARADGAPIWSRPVSVDDPPHVSCWPALDRLL